MECFTFTLSLEADMIENPTGPLYIHYINKQHFLDLWNLNALTGPVLNLFYISLEERNTPNTDRTTEKIDHLESVKQST